LELPCTAGAMPSWMLLVQPVPVPVTYITQKSQSTDSDMGCDYQESQPTEVIGEKMILTFGSELSNIVHIHLEVFLARQNPHRLWYISPKISKFTIDHRYNNPRGRADGSRGLRERWREVTWEKVGKCGRIR
jgi:hypothetical protein